jgi:hypothetical protein
MKTKKVDILSMMPSLKTEGIIDGLLNGALFTGEGIIGKKGGKKSRF